MNSKDFKIAVNLLVKCQKDTGQWPWEYSNLNPSWPEINDKQWPPDLVKAAKEKYLESEPMSDRLKDNLDAIKEITAKDLAILFHETYESLAPDFNYKTRKESAVPWSKVPENNKKLMIAVAEVVIGWMGRDILIEMVEETRQEANIARESWHTMTKEASRLATIEAKHLELIAEAMSCVEINIQKACSSKEERDLEDLYDRMSREVSNKKEKI